MDSWAWCTSG